MVQNKQNRPKSWYCYHVSQLGLGSHTQIQCSVVTKHNASHSRQNFLLWCRPTIHFVFWLTHVASSNLLLVADSWTLKLALVREAFRFLYITLKFFADFTRLAFGLIFVGRPTMVLNVPNFYMTCLTVLWWSPNSLGIILYHFPVRWAWINPLCLNHDTLLQTCIDKIRLWQWRLRLQNLNYWPRMHTCL